MKRLLRGLFARLLVLVRRNRFESDLDDELQFHLEEATRRNVERGMSPEEATTEARRCLGRDGETKEQVRKETGVHSILNRLDAWGLDFKLGFRMMVKYPGLTLAGRLAMAVAFAISVGSTSAFRSMLRTPRPLENVVTVRTWNVTRGRRHEYGASVRDFVRWSNELQSLENLSAFVHFQRRNLITDDGRGDPVNSAEITPSAFRLFRVPPLLGRPLVEEDAREGALPVAVIGYDVWRTRFGSDPTIVGQDVRLGGTVFTVVGVMPKGFAYPVNHGLWTPLRAELLGRELGGGPRVEILGRLGPGVPLASAQAELTTIGLLETTSFAETHDDLRPGLVDYAARHLNVEDTPPGAIQMVQFFFALLILVPFANVAILVYARTARRQGEIAVRNALGANRARIVMQLFVESFVLAAVAAALALLLVRIVFGQINVFLMRLGNAEFPFWYSFSVSSSAVWYLVGLTVLAAAIVGVVPAVQATGRHVHLGLRKVGGGAGMRLGTTWTVLIVVQVAVTVAVLPLAAGVAWNTSRLGFAGPGSGTEDILTAKLVTAYDPPPDVETAADYRREFRARLATVWNEMKSNLEAEPAVAGVTYAGVVPGDMPMQFFSFELEGETAPRDSTSSSRVVKQYTLVDVGFFKFFDIPLLAGRFFEAADRDQELGTVIVDRTFVQETLGDINTVGRRIRFVRSGDGEPGPWWEIVGVVEDFPLNETNLLQFHGAVYSAQMPVSPGLAVRVGSPPATYSGRLREIVTAVDPSLGLSNILPLDEVYRSRLDTMFGRLMAWTISLAILSLLFLSTAGIYALTSFAVSLRRREIGIRVALGAHQHRILGSIFSRAAMQLSLGVALGIAAAVPVAVYWESIPFDGVFLGSPDVPGVLVAVAVIVLAVGLFGSLGPAMRGLSIQAADVLKEE